MLTLYTGTGGGENRAALFNAFVEQVRRGEKCLLLVPEQFTVHAEQEVFRLYGAGLGCDAEVVSFKRLCYRILLAAGGLCLIDPEFMTDVVGVAVIVVVIVLQIVLRKHSKPAAA